MATAGMVLFSRGVRLRDSVLPCGLGYANHQVLWKRLPIPARGRDACGERFVTSAIWVQLGTTNPDLERHLALHRKISRIFHRRSKTTMGPHRSLLAQEIGRGFEGEGGKARREKSTPILVVIL